MERCLLISFFFSFSFSFFFLFFLFLFLFLLSLLLFFFFSFHVGFTENNWSDLKKSIKTSGFPLVGQMHQWERCIEYCRRKEYFMFLMISIPMLVCHLHYSPLASHFSVTINLLPFNYLQEHSLRRAFACENNSTDRLISAGILLLILLLFYFFGL